MTIKKYEKITKKHVDKAISEYLSDADRKIPANTQYFIVSNGEKMPSKTILLNAYKIAYGMEPGSSFHGGKDNAHKFFIEKGWYECIPSTMKDDNSPKKDNVWILPCDNDYYDADTAFKENDFVSWYKVSNSKNVKKGDIVYIYSSNKVKEIRWRCVVGEPNYYLAGDDAEAEKLRSPIQTDEFWNGPFMEIIPEHEFVLHDMLSYAQLKNHGLKSKVVAPQHLEVEVYKYICEVESMEEDEYKCKEHINSIPIDELKLIAEKKSSVNVKEQITMSKTYRRDLYVSQYAKVRAQGICQLCGQPAPFNDLNGIPYLETHHIKWLSRGGADSIKNTAALCPNCHKRMHILDDENDVKTLIDRIK